MNSSVSNADQGLLTQEDLNTIKYITAPGSVAMLNTYEIQSQTHLPMESGKMKSQKDSAHNLLGAPNRYAFTGLTDYNSLTAGGR